MIALQVVRTSFEFHLRECMGSSSPHPPPLTKTITNVLFVLTLSDTMRS